MNNSKFDCLYLTDLDAQELNKLEGGFIPIIILGYTLLTASQTTAVFLTGVGIGVAVAQSHHK